MLTTHYTIMKIWVIHATCKVDDFVILDGRRYLGGAFIQILEMFQFGKLMRFPLKHFSHT